MSQKEKPEHAVLKTLGRLLRTGQEAAMEAAQFASASNMPHNHEAYWRAWEDAWRGLDSILMSHGEQLMSESVIETVSVIKTQVESLKRKLRVSEASLKKCRKKDKFVEKQIGE